MGEDQIVCAGILQWTRRAILLLILAAGTNGMGQESSIDLTKLSVGQLSGLKHQIGGEEKMLTGSYAQLRQASNQFKESREVIKSMKPESVGSSIIVPMTSSLYVKGTLGEVDKVLVDVGTGYFVEKNIEEADDYFRRKVDYVGENLKRVEANIVEKRKNLDIISQCMQMKLEEAEAAKKKAKEAG